MKLLLLLGVLCAGLLASCEQLSTVFVLETSDSSASSYHNHNNNNNNYAEPAPTPGPSSTSTSGSVRESKVIDQEPSTRIITDNSDRISHAANQQHSANQSQHQKQPVPAHQEQQAPPQAQHQKPIITRSTQQSQQKPKQPTTTTTEGYYERDKSYNGNSGASGTPPSSEERLLISITHNDDDEPGYASSGSKPPKKIQPSISSGGSGYDDGPSGGSSQLGVPGQQQQQGPPKRKPSITISIQDGSLKQDGSSGSSGTPSVILRPSENGQSIVISTVGLGKHVNKPISIVGPGSDHVEIPVQHQHQPASTHRPQVSGGGGGQDYLPSANRPISSTLVEGGAPARPVSVSDERPQRPPVGAGEYEREPPRPATQRPPAVSRPPPETNYGGGSGSGPGNGNGNDLDIASANGQEPARYPLNEKNCGLLHETRIVGGEEANPDDYLWMAAIIKSKPSGDGEARPFCGGSLITRRHILTAAHCLENLAPRDVLVRLGSYDFDDATASSLSADYAIDQFRVPGQYSKKTHSADIAIMRLKTPLSASDNYKTVCMPQPRRSYVGALGTVTGYGSQSQTFRKAAPKLRQVTVPIWENRKCSVVYKKNLTESYLCAGYEEGGKDACQGDSGGPLMTEGPNERMMVVGVVSHGIGCGSPGYPGVYTRTTTFIDWIEKNTRE